MEYAYRNRQAEELRDVEVLGNGVVWNYRR